MRLGDYDKHGNICDYGTESCTHYLQFGIEDIIVHSDYKRTGDHIVNNIALIRLDRLIQLGNRIKPICLPFGNNFISASEPQNSFLTVIGWGKTLANNDFVAKSEKSVILSKTERCKAIFAVDNTNICVVESNSNSFNGGLLMREFAHRRWVLEGIASSSTEYSEIKDCSDVNRETSRVYTRVKSYADWLNEKMEMKNVINEQLQY